MSGREPEEKLRFEEASESARSAVTELAGRAA